MTLCELRKAAGLTQDDVSRELGVTVAAVSLWETGKNKPRADSLMKLASIYKCSVDEILKTFGG